MSHTVKAESPFDGSDEERYPRAGRTDFEALTARAVTRRQFLGRFLEGAAAFGAAGSLVLGGGGLKPSAAAAAGPWLAFAPVAANTLDTITLPTGFRWQTVVSWGDPLWSAGPPFDPATRGTAASQALAFGDNNDGMALFTVDGRTILAVNNEYVNYRIFYGNRLSGRPESADDVRKAKAAHGVSIFEIEDDAGRWRVVVDSPYNRRITADTPIAITGPARGHELLRTAADPGGTRSLGTWNNCGSGRTPWGTYLSCEENFDSYFSSGAPGYRPSEELRRYRIGNAGAGYAWALVDERFDLSRHPNEPNRAGYVVEIDPLDPRSAPKKRTALGRLKHENAELVIAADGRVVVYLGDDESGEFVYRFVSERSYRERGDNADLLDDGRLYAAKFRDDGRGEWRELTPESTGMSRAAICVHTRQAGSAVGATTMDRPEWIAADPRRAEVYCCLTHNKARGRKPNGGGDAQPVGGPNPRARNLYGQIVRWVPDGGDHIAPGFAWDLFVMAGNPAVHGGANAGSANLTVENMFNSPDAIAFDTRGGLWIQTDGDYSDERDFAGHGNNQMLLADPESGEIRRFLVGPRECEVTGLCWSADRRTMFVGIQHPGERGGGHWPGGAGAVPRSSVIAISRDDGGILG